MQKRNNNKIKKVALAFLTMFMILSAIGTTKVYAQPYDEGPNVGEKVFSGILRSFAAGIDKTIFQSEKLSIDGLVYNQSGDHQNLTLLNKSSGLRTFVVEFYLIIQYIAVAIFLPLGMWIAVYIVRGGEDAQKLALAKEKIIRFFVTFVLLMAMPEILDILFIVNSWAVSICSSIGLDKLKGAVDGSMIKPGDSGLLMGTFKELAFQEKTLEMSLIYLMSVFLNVWLVFYYFLRDLTMCFLFMIFPIVAIGNPFRKGAVAYWFKEAFAVIFTQTIHALIFTFVVAAAVSVPNTLYNMLFVMTAFAGVIPLTGFIKRMVGLEGSIGAAGTAAGLGMVMGAVALGKGAYSTLKQGGSNVLQGTRDLINLNSQEKLQNNSSVESAASNVSQQLTSVNNKNSTSLEDIEQRRREARNKILGGAGTLIGGSGLGAITTLGSSVYGGKAAMMLGAGAVMMGGKAGGMAGRGVGNAVNYIGYEMDTANQLSDPQHSFQENMDEITGLTPQVLQGTDFKEKEEKALMAKQKLQALGLNTLANATYARMAPQRKSMEELQNIKGSKMYTDKNMSVIYKDTAKGNRQVLWTGSGDESLSKPIIQDVAFNDGSMNLSNERLSELSDQADLKVNSLDVTSMTGYEETWQREYDKILSTKDREWKSDAGEYARNYAAADPDLLSLKTTDGELYNEALNAVKQRKYEELRNDGIGGVSEQVDVNAQSVMRQNLKREEFNKLQKAEMERNKILRERTGMGNIVGSSTPAYFNDKIAPMGEIEMLRNLSNEQAENLIEVSMSPVAEIPNGIGYAYESKYATTYFQVDQTTGYSKVVGVGEGNSSLGNNSMQYSAIKYEDGKVLQDKVKYALEGATFEKSPINAREDFNVNKISEIAPKIQSNEEIIITINKTDDIGQYTAINSRTGEIVGKQNIPQQYIDSENNGHVYHITVNAVGEYQQHYNGLMTDRDAHLVNNSYNNDFENMKKLEKIKNEKAMLEEYLKNVDRLSNSRAVNLGSELTSSL